MLDRLTDCVNTNAPLVRRGRWINLTFTLGVGACDYLITVSAGRVAGVEPRPLATQSGVFSIRASADTWAERWRTIPRRDYHDIWSMLPKGLATLDGDLLPLMQNLQYFKDVIASLREPSNA